VGKTRFTLTGTEKGRKVEKGDNAFDVESCQGRGKGTFPVGVNSSPNWGAMKKKKKTLVDLRGRL